MTLCTPYMLVFLHYALHQLSSLFSLFLNYKCTVVETASPQVQMYDSYSALFNVHASSLDSRGKRNYCYVQKKDNEMQRLAPTGLGFRLVNNASSAPFFNSILFPGYLCLQLRQAEHQNSLVLNLIKHTWLAIEPRLSDKR